MRLFYLYKRDPYNQKRPSLNWNKALKCFFWGIITGESLGTL